jgi:hypothetical protein
VKILGAGRKWTQEEYDYLQDKWGTVSLKTIAKKLGRSENAVLIKVGKLGLGPFLENGEYVTFNQLLHALGIRGSYNYKNISWIQNRGFPIQTKKVRNSSFRVVRLEDWWKWAEENQNFLDFSRFEENALGIEPDWVKEKRKKDFELRQQYKRTPWTSIEDKQLERLINQYKYTYAEISKMMRRTEGAIQRRCNDLGLKGRPLRESPHSKWEDWQLKKLDELIDGGVSYEHMSEVIGKSVKAIRGKVYCLYGTENLDKVRAKRKAVS